jgi:hypothetical protein
MDMHRAVAEARWKSMHAELLRGLALVALRRSEEVQEEGRATRAAIAQRRLAESRAPVRRWLRQSPERGAAPH